MMRSVSPLLDYYDHYGIRTTTLNRGERFCFGLTIVFSVLDYVAYIPIIKPGMEKFPVIRYFHRFSVCSITLSQRHGISLRLTSFLYVILFILTVLISDIPLGGRCLIMSIIWVEYFTLEVVPKIKESSLYYRCISSITLGCRYKLSSYFIHLQNVDMSVVLTGRILKQSLAERLMSTSMFLSLIFFVDVFPLFIMERNLVNRSSSVTLNFVLDSKDWSQLQLHTDCGVGTITLNRGERFCVALAVTYILVLDLVDCMPLIFVLIMYFIFFFVCGRYLVNRFSIVTLKFGLDSNDWSQLHIDFVSEIVNRLHSFEDFMAATGISRTWRSACFATTITRPHQLPWLMHSETPHTHRRRLYSLLNKNRYQLPLSKALCGKRCWGSQHNWVVALGPDYRAHLVPLVKGEPIALPSLDTIRGDAPEEWFRLAHKFILFKDPSHDHELSFLVFAIFSPMNCLAFARVGEGAALIRRGQDEWVTVTNAGNLRFKDVACLDDQVYGLCDEGTLVRFELDAPLLPEVQVIASHQPDAREPRQLYLVESMGKLYMVFRYGYLIPSQRRHVTTSFLVYMFNCNALAFEEVRDLEGHAFFVGDGNSWSIPTSTTPAITNRIYFTDDHWDWPMYLGGAYGGCDLGGFNMANRFMQFLPFGKVSPPSHSRPILVTPPIRLD